MPIRVIYIITTVGTAKLKWAIQVFYNIVVCNTSCNLAVAMADVLIVPDCDTCVYVNLQPEEDWP